MMVGMAMHALVSPTKVMMVLSIFLFSLGEHIQLGMRSTISLNYARKNKGGEALGYQNSVYQIGMLAGYLLIAFSFTRLVASSDLVKYRLFFAIATILMIIGMVISMKLKGDSKTADASNRFYFRKKYRKYYMLEVFYGARKQVFLTFGPYVLILFYKVNASTISLLFAISAALCFLLSPVVGRIIDRLGNKLVMVTDTIILVGVCLLYGFAHHLFLPKVALIVCCVNYVIDAIISMASMASSVYVQDISDNAYEVKATLTTGISVNHAISVSIALFGGWIWKAIGMEALFILSAILGLFNSAYAASIKTKS